MKLLLVQASAGFIMEEEEQRNAMLEDGMAGQASKETISGTEYALLQLAISRRWRWKQIMNRRHITQVRVAVWCDYKYSSKQKVNNTYLFVFASI